MKLLCHWVCATDCRDLHAVDTGFSREPSHHHHYNSPTSPVFFLFIPLVNQNKSSRLPSSDGWCRNYILVVILKMSPVMANCYSWLSLIFFNIYIYMHIYADRFGSHRECSNWWTLFASFVSTSCNRVFCVYVLELYIILSCFLTVVLHR